jgi:hypothetical protein
MRYNIFMIFTCLLQHCGPYLNKLSLGFWDDDDDDFIPEGVAELMKQSPNLRKLKLLSTNIRILTIFPTLMMSQGSLVSVKFALALHAFKEKRTDYENIEEWVNSITASSNFNYEYSLSDVEFKITLAKKTEHVHSLCVM